MKRSEMILQLKKIYESIPEQASSYHIVDMLLYAAERRGIIPPLCNGSCAWEEEDEQEEL